MTTDLKNCLAATEDGKVIEFGIDPNDDITLFNNSSVFAEAGSVTSNSKPTIDIDPTTEVEICDGLDNNCDGVIPANEADADSDGYMICEGDCDDNNAAFSPGANEICDGADNDCDGVIPADEANADGDGYRICAGDCDDGNADFYPGAPELCDGLDNDCDGLNDEDYPDLGDPCTVGLGPCETDGTKVCSEDGQGTVCEATPTTNVIVEGFESGNFSALPWATGGNASWGVVSAARYSGNYSAQAPTSIGHSQSSYLAITLDVSGGSISFYRRVSSESNYDYLRFYIDGIEQNKWAGSIGWAEVSFPVAAGQHTFMWKYTKDGSVNSGSDTTWIDDINFPGIPYTPVDEVCDGTDNNCDGTVDNLPPQSCGSDVGECQSGLQTCAEGSWGECAGEITPSAEVCDDKDNDCNSVIDDGCDDDNDDYCDKNMTVVGTPGICPNGAGDCDDGNTNTYPGASESCDGLDNDCDNVIPDDEADIDGDLVMECAGDCNDNDNAIYPSHPEDCDGKDNDCDPSTQDGNDESWLNDPCDGTDSDKCNEGNYLCEGGSQVCTDNSGHNLDLCNGEDDDCNPLTDDGADETWLGGACDSDGDTDLCTDDAFECVNGAQACTDVGGSILDVCDGVDNDCNPATLDGADETWLGADCDGQDSDKCEEGISQCVAGNQSCTDDTGDNLEVCDGVDNDCNSATADGADETWLGVLCDGPDTDECKEGSSQCINTTKTCTDNTGDNQEICNGLDDDCDGVVPSDEVDNDGDGVLLCANDCDDNNPKTYPGAPEDCDGKDNDCDGEVPSDEVDNDGDQFLACADCDDDNIAVNPGATEICRNGIDDNCNDSKNEICLPIILQVPSVDCLTIQCAIDKAIDGDTVVVADGTYVENINFLGKAITVRSENGPDNTTIDGSASGSVVTFNSGEGAGSVLEGFTIQNGSAYKGGGIGCWESSSPTITNCIVSGNMATSRGAGIYCYSSSPAIANCIISGNTTGESGGGGGICFEGYSYSPTTTNCTIRGNTAGEGGGIYLVGISSAVFINCTVSGNTAGYNGGGFSMRGTSPTIINSTISGNSADVLGGGIWSMMGTSTTVVNSILWGNEADGIPDEIVVNDPDCSITMTYSDIDPSLITGSGTVTLSNNINADPKFVDQKDASLAPTIEGNYHLQSDSPCINVGDTAGAPEYDFEGDSRLETVGGDNQPDIGADENRALAATIESISPDTVFQGEAVCFTGSGVAGNGNEIIEFSWSSDIDGFLSSSDSFCSPLLSPDTHTISFKVKDRSDTWPAETTDTLEVKSVAIGDLSDLALEWDDVSFNKGGIITTNPDTNEPITIEAVIHNIGMAASDNQVMVRFYLDNNPTPIGSHTITSPIAGGDNTAVASIGWTTPASKGYHVIKVKVEQDGNEKYISNNQATHFVVVGAVLGDGDGNDFEGEARIVITASLSSNNLCPGNNLTVSGKAEYEWGGGFRLPVLGALVELRIQDIVLTSRTANEGRYSIGITSPVAPGSYPVEVSITDFSLSGIVTPNLNVRTCSVPPSPSPTPPSVCSVDLAAYPKNIPCSGKVGNGINLIASIYNYGADNLSSAFNTTYEITKLGGEIVFSATGEIPTIGGNSRVSKGFGQWIPSEAGTYFMKTEVDPDKQIVECGENNNVKVQSLVVYDDPDFADLALIDIQGTYLNPMCSVKTMTIRPVIKNNGGVASDATTVHVSITSGGVESIQL